MRTIKNLFGLLMLLLSLSSFGQRSTPGTQSNEVMIQQVGNGNILSSSVVSNSTTLKISQDGDHNHMYSSYSTNNLSHSIMQNGDNNRIFDFQFDPTQENKLNLIQNGDNSHFERFGTNSIGNKMEINMNGNTKSIIVRNFK